jgi:DNA integrity scanning protein DisA with diadenylate cyclase activity
MDDFQTYLNWGGGAALSALGWFARQLWDAVTNLKKDLEALRVELIRDYVPKDDFKETMKELRDMFRHISDKLENKVDK